MGPSDCLQRFCVPPFVASTYHGSHVSMDVVGSPQLARIALCSMDRSQTPPQLLQARPFFACFCVVFPASHWVDPRYFSVSVLNTVPTVSLTTLHIRRYRRLCRFGAGCRAIACPGRSSTGLLSCPSLGAREVKFEGFESFAVGLTSPKPMKTNGDR